MPQRQIAPFSFIQRGRQRRRIGLSMHNTRAASWTLIALLTLVMAPTVKALDASDEVAVRQHLIQVALGRREGDLLLQNARVLNVFTKRFDTAQDVVIARGRIAWVGASGTWTGKAAATEDLKGASVVPGFGESHKHIESSYLTPEYEAALVIPFGNTWTIEGSHEMSNVVGDRNVEYWLLAERAGSPLKVFPVIGSATPPTVYERGGGYYGHEEMQRFMASDLRVVGLGEVMDWPAVSGPGAPGSERIWGMMQATWEARGQIEGHGSGLRSIPVINAFAASGLSSDHEVREVAEGIEKLRRGIFLEVRPDTTRLLFPELLAQKLDAWDNVSVTTDDRDVHATLELGAMDYNIRTAIEAGVAPETAYALGSYNTARHFRIDHLVGSIAPGRYADLVVLKDVATVAIDRVYVNGRKAAEGGRYLLPVPEVVYPEWARNTIKLPRPLAAEDFAVRADPTRQTVQAAIMKPFYFADRFMTETLPVTDGLVAADPARGISKVAMVDRYHNRIAVSKMFWRGVGPLTPGSALASSQSHDLHNIWALGNDDAAMALAANEVARLQGGWALVAGGKVVASVSLEIAGLVSQRPVAAVAAEVAALEAAADDLAWIGNPGLPARMRFAFLTASPWQWQLVAPYEGNPGGFVNVTTGEIHPVIW
ncbi:MAG: adenine deaminase C-terminal domain-containing protein [Pseudomonadota bacterium]